MQRQKKSNSELIYALNLLSKKRGELISPFLDNDPEWFGLTFKYERNQSAFDLVCEKFTTLWIDKHFKQLIQDEIPESVRKKVLSLILILVDSNNQNIDDSSIKHSLLSTKLSIIEEILSNDDNMNIKYNKLKYSYERDKALFEREFLKYENKINTKS